MTFDANFNIPDGTIGTNSIERSDRHLLVVATPELKNNTLKNSRNK